VDEWPSERGGCTRQRGIETIAALGLQKSQLEVVRRIHLVGKSVA
jgi:hypothetical protein